MMDMREKRDREKAVLGGMIALYCRGSHGSKKGALCPECEALARYAGERTEKCHRMAEKVFCAGCRRPCYSPEKREEIRAVMRYAGPRMLLHHPLLLLRHAAYSRKMKRKRAREQAAAQPQGRTTDGHTV